MPCRLQTDGERNRGKQEVRGPATQRWKIERLKTAGLELPPWLSFVAVDFERQALMEQLAALGFKQDQPAFFSWLGVVPYLSRENIFTTLSAIAGVPAAEVLFDYGEPPEAYAPERRAGYEAMIARALAVGEPWLTFFTPDELNQALSALGFSEVEDLSPRDVVIRLLRKPDPGANVPGAHIVAARRT